MPKRITSARATSRGAPNASARNAVRDVVRCAIYTRKSSEEGLEQDFNSLDAQREACEAYITSQRSEGWITLPRLYDDGGWSGGTMERPALKALLADIAAGLVDTVVVYKVDRLTRSLTDFARIVDVFDEAKVSFVSVTQSFNTTTSMGRLTLNMLLSFAQFEREVTGERIRDKIAASKAKGMWMGGRPPLGYTVEDRKLVIVPEEAEQVREIFRRYLTLGSVYDLVHDLAARNIRAKRHVSVTGNQTGGGILERGALYHLLQNHIYRGEITHKDHIYPGQHDPIIDQSLWDAVQQRINLNRVEREGGINKVGVSLLAGLLRDEEGFGFTAVHANKKGRRYRYYVSRDLVNPTSPGEANEKVRKIGIVPPARPMTPGPGLARTVSTARRLPASDIEAIVEQAIMEKLSDHIAMDVVLSITMPGLRERKQATGRLEELARHWPSLEASIRRLLILKLVTAVTVTQKDILLRFHAGAFAAIASIAGSVSLPTDLGSTNIEALIEGGGSDAANDVETIDMVIPCSLRRVGMEMRHIIEGKEIKSDRQPDQSLTRTLALALHYRSLLIHAEGKTITELADTCGVTSSYFSRIVRLGFLSPQITNAILEGRQPIDLSSIKLTLKTELENSWKKQSRQLGF